MPASAATPSRPALIGAFATIYLVWGSTYLGMHIAFTPTTVSISMPGYIDKMLKRFLSPALPLAHASPSPDFRTLYHPRVLQGPVRQH